MNLIVANCFVKVPHDVMSEIRKPFVLLGFFSFLLPFLPFYADATSARWYLCKLETHLQ